VGLWGPEVYVEYHHRNTYAATSHAIAVGDLCSWRSSEL
jgi:hypothetical protein